MHSCGYQLTNDGQDTRAIQEYLGSPFAGGIRAPGRVTAWQNVATLEPFRRG
jgi:hypothetical protein